MRVRGYAPATPCWSVLSTGDAAAATTFYCGLFDWTATSAEDGSTTFLLHDLAVAGLTETPGRPSAWLTYVSTEDVDATAQHVTDAGGSVLLPPTDAGSRGRTALFADAAGAVFGVWQRGTFAGAQVVNEANSVCWSETVTRDVPATATFYGKVFGWTERIGTDSPMHEYHEWLATSRVVGGISSMDASFPPETPAHWRTILLIDDCADITARTTALGGRVLAGPMDAGIGQAAYLIDPTGGAFLVIELIPEYRAAFS
ncbi:VOC family protein [Dactylosporangium fulvum]|uniref:VOC family protein n=1 Tax=Dactylosporangium fulvum TaxID=53359 RepID=A0ABY5VYX0_9ACTN|nr:VOC family protein [Dactylosporangium fulvum]UWP82907.1 VOC family protein [Dactylosporangium fulvum]